MTGPDDRSVPLPLPLPRSVTLELDTFTFRYELVEGEDFSWTLAVTDHERAHTWTMRDTPGGEPMIFSGEQVLWQASLHISGHDGPKGGTPGARG